MTGKLSRTPLYIQAYEAILAMILDGTLGPGERVTETGLARRLGVSSTPIREAIRKLEHDGLLQDKDNSLQIVELTSKNIKDLYLCREALETVALRLAIDELDEVELMKLEQLLDAAERAAEQEDFAKLIDLHTGFHDTFIDAAANPWLTSIVTLVRRPLLLARIQTALASSQLKRVLADHRSILDKVRQRDPDAAVEALRRHLRTDCEYMCRVLSEEPVKDHELERARAS